MNYQFPIITDIEQVREAIAGYPEFIEADKGDYIVFNYLVSHENSFDCPIRRECRGLIFDKNGKVLSRRFHKFFNLGEKEETLHHNIDWTKRHVVLDKLDGSMITFVYINNVLTAMTKMGITDISKQVDSFIKDKPNYSMFVDYCIKNNCTAIFEWTSRQNRIVIDYCLDGLTLLAIRHNITGEYFKLHQ